MSSRNSQMASWHSGKLQPRDAAPVGLRASQPDPDARAFLRLLDLGTAAPPGRFGVGETRFQWRMLARLYGTRESVERTRDAAIDGPYGPIPLRIYYPSGSREPRPVFLYFPGGGFVLGDLASADGTCRALANRSGAVVIAVEYRKAPEYDLHAGRADCLAAVHWVAEHGHKLGVDSSRIGIGGDSAGGNIAAVIAQAAARRGGPRLRLQVLIYPSTDLTRDYSGHENARGYFLTEARIRWFKSHFPRDTDFSDARLSPLLADEFRGLAPAMVLTGGYDPLRDEGLAYADRLRAEGVPVDLLHYPGQIHGFMSFDAILRAGRDALDRVGSRIADSLGTARPQPRARADTLTARPFDGWSLHHIPVNAAVMQIMLLESLAERWGRRLWL